MTHISEVIHDPAYTQCLDFGFVGLKDWMGSDADICQAARTSYGAGTKTINEDRGLIRYLLSHRHTSPIEMAEIKLHIKLPIFVMRQLVRHRTSSLNEYSGRYSVMSDEFYVPAPENIMAQSATNKQGRALPLPLDACNEVLSTLRANNEMAYANYEALLGAGETSDDFPGVARELARIVLPVSNYTELYWKQNLHNLLHMIKLRRDSHAQYEIRVFAEAIYQAIKPLFPATCEAWEDYVWESEHLSRMEAEVLKTILADWRKRSEYCETLDGESPLGDLELTASGLSKREQAAFREKWFPEA